MSVTAATAPSAPWLTRGRGIAIAIGALVALALAAALSVSDFWRPGANSGGSAVQNALNAGANGVSNVVNAAKSVADLLAGRSPGERAEGTLANLKHRKLAALHERALPKVRRPAAASPLAGIVGAAPVPPAEVLPPPAAPLYNVVAGGPGLPVGQAPPPGTGPVIFPAIPPPPGGGGGVIVPPPSISPPVTPPIVIPPTTGSVPEPASWATMLLGFAMIGRMLRRRRPILKTAAR